jgi:hypothetical protein
MRPLEVGSFVVAHQVPGDVGRATVDTDTMLQRDQLPPCATQDRHRGRERNGRNDAAAGDLMVDHPAIGAVKANPTLIGSVALAVAPNDPSGGDA